MLHSDCCQPGVIQQLDITNDVSAIGYFGVGSASLASRISSCHAHVPYPLGRSASYGVEDSVSYSQLVKKKLPVR